MIRGVDDGAVLCPDATRFADAVGWFAAAGLLLLSAALIALAGLIWLEARS